MGDIESEALPMRIAAIDVGVLDPIGRRLKQGGDRAKRDREQFEGGL
jgi:hypothetical protein